MEYINGKNVMTEEEYKIMCKQIAVITDALDVIVENCVIPARLVEKA